MRTFCRANITACHHRFAWMMVLLGLMAGFSWWLYSRPTDIDPVVTPAQNSSPLTGQETQPLSVIPPGLLMDSKPIASSVLPQTSSVAEPQRETSGAELAPEDTTEHDPLTLLAVLDLPELLLPELFNAKTLEVFQRMHIALDVDAEQLDRHFEKAQDYLASQLENPDDVAALMAFYRRYTEFELNQAVDPAPLWQEAPQDAEAAVALNQAKQDYRRAYFGTEIADQVWGESVRDADYHHRMVALVRDESYGDDSALRAQLIQQLPDAHAQAGATDLTRMNPAMYSKLVRNGEALLAMPESARQQAVQAYWRESREE